jgi:hypothetical protein
MNVIRSHALRMHISMDFWNKRRSHLKLGFGLMGMQNALGIGGGGISRGSLAIGTNAIYSKDFDYSHTIFPFSIQS